MNLSSEDQAQQQCLPDSVARSSLFKLPPEIRNMIYRFALLADDDLIITKTQGIPEAALLSVNKLVRSETYEIFYRENNFCCVLYNDDCAPLLLASQKFLGHCEFSAIDLTHGMVLKVESGDDERNWKNLVAWFHCCHQRVCCGLGSLPNDNAEESLLGGLFKMVISGPNITTSALDFLLESMRPPFVKLHQDWAKD